MADLKTLVVAICRCADARTLIPHLVAGVRGIFSVPIALFLIGPGLLGKDGRLEAEGFEPFKLDGIQWPVEPSLGAHSDNGGVFELAGDHQSRGTGSRFIVPAGQGTASLFVMFSEQALDESPDEKRDEQDKAQSLDAFFRLEEDRIHHGEVRKQRGSKEEILETIRGAFRLVVVDSMETIYRLILASPQKYQLVPFEDST